MDVGCRGDAVLPFPRAVREEFKHSVCPTISEDHLADGTAARVFVDVTGADSARTTMSE